MAKAKKKGSARRSASPISALPAASLPSPFLEKAAQGWLQSSGTAAAPMRPSRTVSDQRLAEALGETLRELREEISELRARLDRLESR